MPQPQNIIAIVYDYDRTLSPTSMQDDVLFDKLNIDSSSFWETVGKMKIEKSYEDEVAWIRLLLDTPAFRSLSNEDLRDLGSTLKFYPGVPEIFPELSTVLKSDKYLRHDVTLEHYIVTSGLKAILSGSVLNEHVERIFGCELDEDEHGKVYWPKRIVSHTSKTQYLFRITKGPEYVDLSRDVNDHMPEVERRIPFRNMLYIGDGPTDVPCFAVITSREGKALAVYDPTSESSFQTCMALQASQRVDVIAEANYTADSHLRRVIQHYVVQIADRIISEQRSERDNIVIEAPKHG